MNLTELKRHAAGVCNKFFSKGNARYFGSSKVFGIYRQPYMSGNDGYVIAEMIFTGSDGVAAPAEYAIHRFESTPNTLEWSPIGRHATLADAESFLAAMGATK